MCWSGEASLTLATLGFAGAYWSRWKGHEPFRWAPLAYFSVMETLQGITYSFLGDCGQANQTLTTLSYIHICFQPFFVNMFAMSWLAKEDRRGLSWAWWISAFCTGVMLLMLLNYGSPCNPIQQPLCGTSTCSYHGEWHIAWSLVLTQLDQYYLMYWLSAFIVPILYRSWRFVLYHFTLGPLLAWNLTANKDERPAVWCLASIAFLLATHIPVISRLLTVPKRRKNGLVAQR